MFTEESLTSSTFRVDAITDGVYLAEKSSFTYQSSQFPNAGEKRAKGSEKTTTQTARGYENDAKQPRLCASNLVRVGREEGNTSA